MVDLVFTFKTAINFLIFILVASAASYWNFIRLKRKLRMNFTPAIVLNGALFLSWIIIGRLHHDEGVHIHLSWLLSKGLLPYKDFWFHHSPLLWIILAPLVSLLEGRLEVFELSRFLALSVFAANAFLGWKIAEKVWRKNADLKIYLLILASVSIGSQLQLLRADIFMTFFLLAGIYIFLDALREKILPCFLTGVCFGLAASFLVKQYLLYLLPLIMIFFAKEKRFLKSIAYLSGLCAGILPLVSYLISEGIIGDYFYWVFIFNKSIVVFSISLPLFIALAGAWGAYALFKLYRKTGDVKPMIIFLAFCLSTLSSLTSTKYAKGGYYLSFWFFMCAITASGCDIDGLFARIPSQVKRSLAVGVVFATLLVPNIKEVFFSGKGTFFRDKEVVKQLKKYTERNTCVAVMPLHPIFARDATRFFSYSQYLFSEDSKLVRDDIRKSGIAAKIIALRPAVVACFYLDRDLILELFQKGLISAEDYKNLVLFFRENYTKKKIGEGSYYIRNDRL